MKTSRLPSPRCMPSIKLVRQRDQNAALVKVLQSQREEESIPLSYKKIFYTNTEKCQNIYITGNAGMGKTTFCKQLVHMWCKAIQNIAEVEDSDEDIDVLKEFSLLFYVNFREVESIYHIGDMIRENVLHNAPIDDNVSDILKKEKCLVVLDGLDEWSCPKHVNKCRGLNKDIPCRNTMNKNCTYLTTTRNWKFDVIDLKSKDCDKHVELCGIDKVSSEELAQKTLCLLSAESQYKKEIDDFFEEVKEKNLNSLTSVPVLLIHLVTFWYFCKDLGKSQVQLYCKMLELLLEQAKKHLPEKTSTVTKPVQTDVELPGCFSKHEANCHNHAHLLLCLSKLAFMSLLEEKKEDSLVFKNETLKIYCIDSSDISLCLKCGILTQNKVLGNPMGRYKKYSFLHKKLQEFLAAVYLVTSHNLEDSMKKIRKYCNKLDTTLEMGQMFMFVCGMKAAIGNQVLDHLTSVVSDDKTVQNCRQSDDDELLIKDIHECVMACLAEGASNGLKIDVCLQDCYVDKDTISDYVDHVVERKITRIKSVYIYSTDCRERQVTRVLEHLQKVTTLEKLLLGNSSHVVSDSSIVAPVLTSNISTLKSLCLWDVDLLHQETLFTAVLGCIPSLRVLVLVEKLDMVGEMDDLRLKEKKCVNDDQLEQPLSATQLTHLHLHLYQLCRKQVLDLSHYTQLQTLRLWYISVTNLHVVAHSVEKVELWDLTVAHSTLRQFIEALAQSSNKVEVELRDVTVTKNIDDLNDTAAYLRDCGKFTVEKCKIWRDYPRVDQQWDWVKFHKK